METKIIKLTDRKPQTEPQLATLPRELLLQWREGLLLQLRAIEKLLWPNGKRLESKAQKV
jgi:hypothetical protein